MTAFGEERFAAVRDALAARGADALDRDAFLLDGTVGTLLRDLVPPDAPAETVTAYGALLHALYCCWERDWPVARPDAATLRAALASRSPLPAPRSPLSCYIQLPEHLVWAQTAAGEPHEPLDGVLLVVKPPRAEAVAVLGLREGRDGFTTMESRLDLPAEPPGERADGSAPYASVLPGGDRAHLLSVVDHHELAALGLLALAAAEA
jgi:hypothetical protein